MILGKANTECAGCGKLREVSVRKPADWWTALTRLCGSCATLMRHNDVDPLAVDHLIAGYRINVTPGERSIAIAHLTRSGRSARVIAERIGCTPRTVTRHRSRMAHNQ